MFTAHAWWSVPVDVGSRKEGVSGMEQSLSIAGAIVNKYF